VRLNGGAGEHRVPGEQTVPAGASIFSRSVPLTIRSKSATISPPTFFGSASVSHSHPPSSTAKAPSARASPSLALAARVVHRVALVGKAVSCGIGRGRIAPYGSEGGVVRPVPPTCSEGIGCAFDQSASSNSGSVHARDSSRASNTSGICGESVCSGADGVHAADS
jgi:hypothetical protein